MRYHFKIEYGIGPCSVFVEGLMKVPTLSDHMKNIGNASFGTMLSGSADVGQGYAASQISEGDRNLGQKESLLKVVGRGIIPSAFKL